jgi:hypothetical protein
MRSSVQFVSVCLAVTSALACGSGSSATPDATPNATPDATPNACTYTGNSTPTSAVSSEGCAELTFDMSSCLASRQALGLTGAWLRFSCRVTLTKTTKNGADYVVITTDNHPQHKSSYYGSTDACYQADSADRSFNTSRGITASITTATETMEVLLNPVGKDSSWTEVGKGSVGVAVDGVAILSPLAGPDSWTAFLAGGGDIWNELNTLDRCKGHPTPSPDNLYHYHSEPPSVSQDDSNLIGVLADGFFLYGRKDSGSSADVDTSTFSNDQPIGHVGVTADSAGQSVFHYHPKQFSNSAKTSSFYSLTGRYFKGTASSSRP